MRNCPTPGRRNQEPLERASVDAAMERYAAGDDSAFALVYASIAPRLYAYLVRRTRDAAAAEDILQQTLLHIHRARESFIAGSPVTPWAFSIARRLFVDCLRHARRETTTDGAAESLEPVTCETGEQTAEALDVARRLSERLARLPESQRAAFELLCMDGLSHCEAAHALGISVNAVKLRAHRAHAALQAVVEGTSTKNSGG